MKALIVSDIHANMVALERIQKRESDCDLMICAGDLVDFGFQPNEVIDWVRQHADFCVSGNHDRSICAMYEAIHNETIPCDGTIGWHNADRLTVESYQFLKALPMTECVTLGKTDYGLVHQFGRQYELMTTVQQFQTFCQTHWQRYLKGLIMGHTHRPEGHTFMDGYHWLNPGSVSYRKDDDPSLGAHYLVWIDGEPEWRFIEGDYHQYYPQLESLDLNAHHRCRVGWKFRAMADQFAEAKNWPAGRTV